MKERRPGFRGDLENPSTQARGEGARAGFGGKPHGPFEPPGAEAEAPALESKIPFGGSGWQRLDVPSALDDDDGDEAPRRRKPPAPPPYPRRTLAALGAAARVTRDDAGIPHIVAKSERDAYAALGFCMAEDRLWQMDLVRRMAVGRAAELLGLPFAHHDALVRTSGLARRAAAMAVRLGGAGRDLLAAFTAGVNTARADGRPAECQTLGYEIEPWTLADSLAVELLLSWGASLRVWPRKLLAARVLAAGGMDRARSLCPGLENTVVGVDQIESFRGIDLGILEVLDASPSPIALDGSSVALSAAGGSAILAADLGAAPTLPPLVYLAHLETAGASLAGAAFVGTVLFPVARTRACAWAASTALAGDAGCVLEELDGIGNYRAPSGWSKLRARRELVRVRGGENLKLEVTETHNGPLVSRLANQLLGRADDPRLPAVAVRWGGSSPESGIPGWLALARARSVAEIGDAVRLLERGPVPLTVLAADRDGVLGRWTVAARPMRDGHAALPLRGWATESSARAVERLAVESDTVVGPGSVAIAVQGNGDGDPAAGATDRLQWAIEKIAAPSADALRNALAEGRDPLVPMLHRTICAALRGHACADPALGSVADLLEEWDGSARPDSVATAVFHLTVQAFLPRELFSHNRLGALGERAHTAWRAVGGLMGAGTSVWLADESSRDRVIVAAVAAATAWLSTTLGPDRAAWAWAAVTDTTARHPLAGLDSAAGEAPILSAVGSPLSHRLVGPGGSAPPLRVSAAVAARMVADLERDEVQLALAGGESGRSGTSHGVDLLERFRAGLLQSILLTPESKGERSDLVPG
jgi:penicillin G amidase